jgi:plastocyanin
MNGYAVSFSSAAALCLLTSISIAQETATLRMQIVVDGAVPGPKQIAGVNDAFCAEFPLLTDSLLVGEKGELKNFALILDEDRTKIQLPDAALKAPEETHVLDNNRCMFQPKIVVARPGQTIQVKNSDNTGHNANFQFLRNPPTNFLIPAGQSKDLKLKPDLVEPTAMPVDCNIHPWMKAFVIVKQHPFVGISNDQGIIEIPDLPTGKGVVFRLWHEATRAIGEIEVGGKSQKLSRGNRWELELKPGVNDLGVVKLSAKLFSGN